MAIKQVFLVLLVAYLVHAVVCCGASAKKKTKISKHNKNFPKMSKNCCKDKKSPIKSQSGKSQSHQKSARSFLNFASKLKHTTKIPTSLPFVPNKVKHDDPCASWMHCPVHHHHKVKAWFLSLPACPCHFPLKLFDNNTLYDQIRKRAFSWKVVDTKIEMLSVFKPGAVYCVRQLFDPVLDSPAAQQCCYDNSYKLITRGSGAGTPNLIAPELDFALHNKLDLEPLILCQGDWTRYQAIRHPNNEYNCTDNPGWEEFKAQVKKARDY